MNHRHDREPRRQATRGAPRPRRRRAHRKLAPLAAVVAIAIGPAPSAEPAEGDRPDDRLAAASEAGATVWERAWYRQGANAKVKPFTGNGDLILWEDALEFVHKRKGWTLPFTDISAVEFGKMRGDRDLDWILLVAPETDIGPYVAVRDGGSFGFGRHSRELFVAVRDALREAGAAQWSVPVGRAPFDGLSHQIRFSIPEGWGVVAGATDFRDGVNRSGMADIVPDDGAGIGLDRRIGAARDRCEALSAGTRRMLRQETAAAPELPAAALEPDAVEVSEGEIGGCAAVRLSAIAGGHAVEVRAVQHRRTLFVFRVAGPAAVVDRLRGELDALVGTVAFPLLRRFDDD